MSVNKYILTFDVINDSDFTRVGGKCASLADMTRAGVRVPPGFAVTTDAFRELLDTSGLEGLIASALSGLDMDDIKTVDGAASTIQASIATCSLPPTIEKVIRSAYNLMGDSLPVAVRSSATAEDLPDASFAGQQDTFLWVVGADMVIQKIRQCWASLYTSRAIVYRAKNNIPNENVLMSVAVQKMVNASAAGVAMTLDPNTGDRTKIVIDSSFGLGETVVSGLVTPDHFVVEKVLMEVLDRKVSEKHTEMVADVDAGHAVEREIVGERRTASSLSDAQVLAVAGLAKSLEKQKKCPQDVEWAFDAHLPEGENLFALQSRPETIWSRRKKSDKPKDSAHTKGMLGMVSSMRKKVVGVSGPGSEPKTSK